MTKPLRIGNAQAFWGDSPDAPAKLVRQQPDLDYLTLDYLAEVSLSILAIQQERDPDAGYARDFVDVVRSLVPFWRGGSAVRVITNAGGLNPRGCAMACLDALRESGSESMKIGIVSGDDVLVEMKKNPDVAAYENSETGEPIGSVLDSLVTANVYLGAQSVSEVLAAGANIVITGRVADPSLTVAPCVSHFDWSWKDYDRIAGATIAGHLIECGTQVTGGISTDWLEIPDLANIGFPVIEVSEDGSCFLTKPPGTGGVVNERTVKEQLLYEIGDPANYQSPDAVVSFLELKVDQRGTDRVEVSSAKGMPPTSQYKVGATYRSGFGASGMLTIFGRDAACKARRCGQIVLERVRGAGFELEQTNIECLGTGDVVPIGLGKSKETNLLETVLRISVADPRIEAVERFRKELASLVTAGPQGTTGYAAGRPRVHPIFGFWPCLIDRSKVEPVVEILET